MSGESWPASSGECPPTPSDRTGRTSGVKMKLALILALAFVLRVAFLSTIPNGFWKDEARDGYDAYCIMETGRDQYGAFLPLFARAFDDYNETLYLYVAIPFIKACGLNELGVRLPAAIVGTLTVLALFHLARTLWGPGTGLLASLLLAVSPWHVQFSRMAFRQVLLPLLFVLGLSVFLRGFQTPSRLTMGAAILGLSLHTYSSARVFVPLFLAGLVIANRRKMLHHRGAAVCALAVFAGFVAILLPFWISEQGMMRARTVGIAPHPAQILLNYLSYYSPDFLVRSGDPNPRHSVPGMGTLLPFEMVTVLAGMLFLLFRDRRRHGLAATVLFLWLVLYPLPACLFEPSHASRAIVGSALFPLFSAHGLSCLLDLVSRWRRMALTIAGLVIATSTVLYCKRYFVDYPHDISGSWQFGMRDAIAFAERSPFDCVIVSDRFSRAGTHILFYTRYPPAAYQRAPIPPEIQSGYTIGKYRVQSITELHVIDPGCLYMVRPDEARYLFSIGRVVKVVSSVFNPKGNEVITFVVEAGTP